MLNGFRGATDTRGVGDPEPEGPRGPGGHESGYAGVLRRLIGSLREVGSFGLVSVDGSPLQQVEDRYGVEAHRQVVASLVAAVEEVSRPFRDGDDVVTSAGGWRNEVSVFVFRPRDDDAFYGEGLETLRATLADHLEKNGARLFYPYLRAAPALAVGSALGLHNPISEEVRVIRRALEQAREDGALHRQLDRRARRRDFTATVFGERIHVLFEPIVNLASRDTLGFEALSRGPTGSSIQSPGALFQAAEEHDLLYEVDSLCRRKALEGAHGLAPGKKLFLNCLPAAIRDPSFRGEALRTRLERMRLRPCDVVFEITERESIGNLAMFREARDHFASLGLGIALDDMGVGYSSLARIMEIAPDYIKVDQSLVRSIDTDPPRQELLRALNRVAESLNAQLIAEGIETSEELAMLQQLGVPYGQGYLLGRAAPLRRVR